MEYQQKYSRGKPVTTLTCRVLSTESKDRQGTSIQFWPDKQSMAGLWVPLYFWLSDFMIYFLVYCLTKPPVFTTAIEFDYNTVAGRIRELAFLNPKVNS